MVKSHNHSIHEDSQVRVLQSQTKFAVNVTLHKTEFIAHLRWWTLRDQNMDDKAKIQLIGGLRIGNPEDESFYDNLLVRLPKEVKKTGSITRFVAFDYLTDDENTITFLGIEVDSIETIPEGLFGWVLSSQYLTILEPNNGNNEITWQEEVIWQWIDESPSDRNRNFTGEFTVRVPQKWTGESKSDQRYFTMSINIYIAPGQKGSKDSIHLAEYDPTWPHKFNELSDSLHKLLGADIALRIEHHGSTSIPGMVAKPIIDVLVVVPSFLEARRRALPLLNDPTWEYVWYHSHIALIKRDTFLGERIFHVHMMPECHMFKRYLAFRDYLRSHPDDASRYAALKKKLAECHSENREQYTNAKADFVNEIVDLAMKSA